MTEKPIIFSGPMVTAILEGRKTQTRRVVKPEPPDWCAKFGYTAFTPRGSISGRGVFKDEGPAEKFFRSPYGVRGTRLWVREQLSRPDGDPWLYAADRQPVIVAAEDETAMIVWAHHKEQDYCLSIHMPRWASRIILEVVSVRVERVQEISETDARAEGYPKNLPDCDIMHFGGGRVARHWYRDLWNAINGKRPNRSWADNPFVWVVEFKVVPQ